MQNSVADAVPTIPLNPLVQEQTSDTLAACANVLALLMDVKDTRQEAKELAPLSEAAEDGVSWIEMLVLSAISYEAKRSSN